MDVAVVGIGAPNEFVQAAFQKFAGGVVLPRRESNCAVVVQPIRGQRQILANRF